MKLQIWLILALISNSLPLVCQIEDNFSTEDSLNASLWSGDLSHFSVESNQLKLKAPAAGTSTIITPIIWKEGYELTWKAWLNFLPSDHNNVDIVIWANEDNSESIYLHFGENGSQDHFILYHRSDDVIEILNESSDVPILATSFFSEIKAVYNQGKMDFYFSYSPEFSPTLSFSIAAPNKILQPGYTGLICNYTSTRRQKFYFDDFYHGPERVDTMPPRLESFFARDDHISLEFSERVFDISPSSYTLLPDAEHPVEVQRESLSPFRNLIFAQNFDPTTDYELDIMVSDGAGNILDTAVIFRVPKSAEYGDLVINEVLFNPVGDGADFVEIYNRSHLEVSLHDVLIGNDDKNEFIPLEVDKIPPQSVLAITSNRQSLIEDYFFSDDLFIVEQFIPSFNNDDGIITLRHDDMLVDSVSYDENMHHPVIDDVDGVSLFRIEKSPHLSTDISNWSSTTANFGFATPGVDIEWSKSVDNNYISLSSDRLSPNTDGI